MVIRLQAKCSNAVETYSPRKKNVADCDVICLDDIDKPTEHQEGNSLEDDVIICEPDCTETEKRIGISSGNSYFKKQWGQPKVVDDEVSTRENRFQIVPESTSTGTKNKLVQTGPTMGNKGTGNNCPHELPSACAGNELEQNGMNIDVNTTECEQKGEEMSDSMCENREVEQTVEEKEFDVNVARNENEFASSSTCQRKELEENKIQDNLIAQQISEGILTDSMLDQEKKLHQKHLEEEKEIVTKVRSSLEF